MDSFYVASTGLTKISILLFYRRLADGTISPTFRISVLTSIAFVAAYIIVFIVTPLLGCRPLNAFWRSVTIAWLETHVEGVDWVCFNEGASDLAASVISMIQDFLACGMPILLFWKLRLPRRQKIALGAIFGVGFLSVKCLYLLCPRTHCVIASASPPSFAAYTSLGFSSRHMMLLGLPTKRGHGLLLKPTSLSFAPPHQPSKHSSNNISKAVTLVAPFHTISVETATEEMHMALERVVITLWV